MSFPIDSLPVPLHETEEGVVLVTGTRVPLDTVIHAHLRGDTPEAIARGYSTLKLEDVYAVIAFYLMKRDQVEGYLQRREKQRLEVRREAEARSPSDGLRERLLARKAGKESLDAPVPGG
jgi:uncharacterized protein (DUF433 family)